MSDYWYRALILCKETGSCNCFATANQPNEEKEEDTNHQVVVSDTMQLVQDKQEVTEITAVTSRLEGGFFGRQQGKIQKNPAVIPEDDVRVDQIRFLWK
ncbi:guanine nucleotide exchange factor DBS-like [Chamaea fasciata]|uniref:guanine nucleotide exchange factor DBS-like n=1 Tax=Chamaea fasciata TaxID=190680 RepID=UPI00336A35CA